MMKKIIRQVTITLIFIIMIAQMSIVTFAALNIPMATSDFYVNDFAGVFSEDEKASLIERAVDLANTYDGIQVVITTVKSLEGATVEDYANALYNQYEIGKDDMGLLILLSTGDREIRVEVGQRMEAYVNDSKAGRFIDDYAIPKLRDGKFNEGLISLQTELIKEIKFRVEKTNELVEPKEPISINWGAIVFSILVIAILGTFIILVLVIYKQSKKNKEQKEELSNLSIKLQNAKEDTDKKVGEAKSETDRIRNQKQQRDKEYEELNNRFKNLEDRYYRGRVLFSNLDAEIDAMIAEEIRQQDMKKAASVDSEIQKVVSLSASKDSLVRFEYALQLYDALTKNQQGYVNADVGTVRRLYEESMKLKHQHLATVAVGVITGIISEISVGKEKHIKDLEKAKNTYDQLSADSKRYVKNDIPEEIDKLLKQARKDKKEREEREAEKRRKRLASSSSYRSSSIRSSGLGSGGSRSSHSGFGGRSGGGGASRRF